MKSASSIRHISRVPFKISSAFHLLTSPTLNMCGDFFISEPPRAIRCLRQQLGTIFFLRSSLRSGCPSFAFLPDNRCAPPRRFRSLIQQYRGANMKLFSLAVMLCVSIALADSSYAADLVPRFQYVAPGFAPIQTIDMSQFWGPAGLQETG